MKSLKKKKKKKTSPEMIQDCLAVDIFVPACCSARRTESTVQYL
jgi:hypothetical protein